MTDWGHLWYALAWASFGLGHSALASRTVKDRLHCLFGRGYRLAYNLFAALHIGAVWWVGRTVVAPAPLGLPPWLGIFGDACTVAGMLVLVVAMRDYDGARFLGLHQLRHPAAPEDEPLRLGGLHRFVRHPLYSGLFLVLWGHAQTEFALATAVWASLYLLVGTMYEERRLVALYGDAYVRYRARIPALLPWRRPLARGESP